MNPGPGLVFPSRDFEDFVAALCHGTATDAQVEALHVLLKAEPAARDAYLLRVELHARLASDPDLFAGREPRPEAAAATAAASPAPELPFPGPAFRPSRPSRRSWPWALAASIAVLLAVGAGWFWSNGRHAGGRRAVALLNRTVNARWQPADRAPRLGAPLEPGRLRLVSGLAQVVFYNGARVVLEGPAELEILSSSEAVCTAGRLTAEVPPQARGFRVSTPRMEVTDLGTAFGLQVAADRADLHVFTGHVEFTSAGVTNRDVPAGRGAVVEGAAPPRSIEADPGRFASLFDLQARSVAADAQRYDQWRAANRRWNRDPALRVHLDFEQGGAGVWRLPDSRSAAGDLPDAAVVGCQWTEGRWATKPALEFRGVSDRVRLQIPGGADSVTLAAWVRVQGLDRQINSLFMADGFAPGTLHWVARNDGVLGLTVIGAKGAHQILTSPPVLTVDQLGLWTHVAVVLDGRARTAFHYVNGQQVSRHAVRIGPPYRFGPTEIGNWNSVGFRGDDPFLVRNFSGVLDQFLLFGRALSAAEVSALYEDGRPQTDPPSQAVAASGVGN